MPIRTNMLTVRFPEMAALIPEGRVGSAEVKHLTISERASQATLLRAAINGAKCEYIAPGKYAQLYVDGKLMMSDTTAEKMANSKFVSHARGRVLIAGLGLGMVLYPTLLKPNVTNITVVEINKDVIELIQPHVRIFPGANKKLEIINNDIYDYEPPVKFDTIYFDIWPESPSEEEQDELEATAANWAPNAWIGFWTHPRA